MKVSIVNIKVKMKGYQLKFISARSKFLKFEKKKLSIRGRKNILTKRNKMAVFSSGSGFSFLFLMVFIKQRKNRNGLFSEYLVEKIR